jgi:hypothetical protein
MKSLTDFDEAVFGRPVLANLEVYETSQDAEVDGRRVFEPKLIERLNHLGKDVRDELTKADRIIEHVRGSVLSRSEVPPLSYSAAFVAQHVNPVGFFSKLNEEVRINEILGRDTGEYSFAWLNINTVADAMAKLERIRPAYAEVKKGVAIYVPKNVLLATEQDLDRVIEEVSALLTPEVRAAFALILQEAPESTRAQLRGERR